MTIECKDLEWERNGYDEYVAYGARRNYVVNIEDGEWVVAIYKNNFRHADIVGDFTTIEEAQAAANEHNKQQFQAIIEEWRKG